MTATIAIPVWLVVLASVLAAWAVLDRFLVPSVRWFLRRRVNRLINDINTRLEIEIRSFELTKRQVLIDRLMYDPQVLDEADAHARKRKIPREVVMGQVATFAHEIVPAFNAYVYFRVGIWLAKKVANLMYKVRLDYTDDEGFAAIDPKSTVVFVMNHRSNMDYILVGFLVAERAKLSYAVGEWARVWPLRALIQAMGAYFVRRRSGNPVYRRVLERYVQMAIEAGVTQAVYPEGGLTRDGKLRPPKFGLVDYMVKGFDPAGERDLVFIPVGINYDRVLEDRSLLLSLDKKAPKKGMGFALATTFKFAARNVAQMVRGRWHGFGYACVNFGTPISMRDYLKTKALDFRGLKRRERAGHVEALVHHLMEAVGRVVPVLPVSLVATTLLHDPDRMFSELELKAAALRLMERMRADGGHVYIPRSDEEEAISAGLDMLRLRHLVGEEDGLLSAREGDMPVLAYYANAVAHLLPAEKGKAAE